MRFRVTITGPNYGWSCTYHDAADPEEALGLRLRDAEPGTPEVGTAEVVPLTPGGDGEPRYFRWLRLPAVVLKETRDRRVIRSLTHKR